jgi:UDP-N-acetylmuramoyl-tripeptide--D-alanyl-D-alanine ligase
MKTLREIGAVLGIQVNSLLKPTGFAVNSRSVQRGHLFWALKGQKVDGHSYLKEAAMLGAVAAVVQSDYLGDDFGLVLLRAPSVQEALHTLARSVMAERKSRVVGITGSVGKTTTKEFLATLLEGTFRVAKTPGNANSQAGLPLAILNEPGGEEIFVAEMGMSHPGELSRLVQIAPPEVAVITRIGHAHIEAFPDGKEGIARAKAEILSHPGTRAAVMHESVRQFHALRDQKSCRTVTFALAPDPADVMLIDRSYLSIGGQELGPFRLPFTEKPLCENFLAAALAARELGLEWPEILARTHLLKGMALRFEKIERGGVLFVNDCYNANPESMRAAILDLPLPRMGGKVVAVFGEMTELGSYSAWGHTDVAELALSSGVDHLLCYGKGCLPMVRLFSDRGRPSQIFGDLTRLKETLFELIRPGDVVLIKGSNINRLWQLLE